MSRIAPKIKSAAMEYSSAMMTKNTYLMYFNRIMEIGISIFEWINLPPTIDERFLEYTLFTDGMAVFFRDEVLGELALQTMIGGRLNVYRIPMDRTAYASNGYNRHLSGDDSVIIFNNMLHNNMLMDAEMYARRMANYERTIDVNIHAQRTPVFIECTESQRLTMQNLYKKYEGYEPFIFGNKNIDLSKINVLNTQAPYVGDKIQAQKEACWRECLTWLGVPSVNTQKKERMITDEVMQGNGDSYVSKYTRLNMRKQACKQINNMFGLDIDVRYRMDIVSQLNSDVSRETFFEEDLEVGDE